MTTLPLLGIEGLRFSGKDTVVRILQEEYGYQRESLGDHVKRELVDTIVADGTYPNSESAKQELLLYLEEHKRDASYLPGGWVDPLLKGWAMMRRSLFGEDYWLKRISLQPGRAVSDVRFMNECDAITKKGGILWCVDRPGVASDGHISESTILPYDILLHNDGDLDALRDGVREAYRLTCGFPDVLQEGGIDVCFG